MPRSKTPQTTLTDRGPNVLARMVAGLGVSLRAKLVFAFLGITCLLVGVTMYGLNALQQANARTEAMIFDQERIAYFNDIYGFLAELNSLNLAMHVDVGEREPMDGGFFGGPTATILSRVNTLQVFVGQGVRRFGGSGMQDAAYIAKLRQEILEIKEIAQRINKSG